jgi:hypothetical protein
MNEVAMLCWDRPNASKFNLIEQVGGPEAAQVYFHLMQGKRLTESDVAPLLFSSEEVSDGLWPDFADLTAGLCLFSSSLIEILCEVCDIPDEVYQFFEPRWMSKPDGAPDYKICNLLDLRRDAYIEDKVMLTPDDPEVSQGRVSFVDKSKVEGAKHLIRLKAGRVIAVQPLLGKLMDQRPVGLWFRNRVRWAE